MYQIIDGNKTAAEIRGEIALAVRVMKVRGERVPHLAAILVGNDGVSEIYVSHKVKDCEEVGFRSTLIRMDASSSEQELLARVDELNRDPELDGSAGTEIAGHQRGVEGCGMERPDPSCVHQAVDLRVNYGVAFLHAAVVPPADDRTVPHQHRTDGNASL